MHLAPISFNYFRILFWKITPNILLTGTSSRRSREWNPRARQLETGEKSLRPFRLLIQLVFVCWLVA